MIRLKRSFKLKLAILSVYYTFVIFVAKEFGPDLVYQFHTALFDFPLGKAAIFFIMVILAGTIITAYIIVIPLAFFEQKHKDKSLEKL